MKATPDLFPSNTVSPKFNDVKEPVVDILDIVRGPYSYMRKRLQEIGCGGILVLPHPHLGFGSRDDFKKSLDLMKKNPKKVVCLLP